MPKPRHQHPYQHEFHAKFMKMLNNGVKKLTLEGRRQISAPSYHFSSDIRADMDLLAQLEDSTQLETLLQKLPQDVKEQLQTLVGQLTEHKERYNQLTDILYTGIILNMETIEKITLEDRKTQLKEKINKFSNETPLFVKELKKGKRAANTVKKLLRKGLGKASRNLVLPDDPDDGREEPSLDSPSSSSTPPPTLQEALQQVKDIDIQTTTKALDSNQEIIRENKEEINNITRREKELKKSTPELEKKLKELLKKAGIEEKEEIQTSTKQQSALQTLTTAQEALAEFMVEHVVTLYAAIDPRLGEEIAQRIEREEKRQMDRLGVDPVQTQETKEEKALESWANRVKDQRFNQTPGGFREI